MPASEQVKSMRVRGTASVLEGWSDANDHRCSHRHEAMMMPLIFASFKSCMDLQNRSFERAKLEQSAKR